MQITIDLTNLPVGVELPIADMPTMRCPRCGRVGYEMQDKFCHVVTPYLSPPFVFPECVIAPVWVSDMCNLDDGGWTIAEPAVSITNRVKHKINEREKEKP